MAEFVNDARLFVQGFEDVALLLNTHRVDEDGDETWPAERREAYKGNAQKFLEVTRRMADLEWTRQDWQFLAKRNKRTLLSTAEGRATLEQMGQSIRSSIDLLEGESAHLTA